MTSSSSSSDLFHLLQQLLLPNNELLHAAEASFHHLLENQCEATIITLFQLATNPAILQAVRQLAAILLRRNLIEKEESCYFKLSPNSQQGLLSELIRVIQEEKNNSLRTLLSEIAGELGGSILDSNDWPALPMTTLALCKSGELNDRVIGLALMGYLGEGQLAASTGPAFLQEALQILAINFQPPFHTSPKLLLANVKALNFLLQATRSVSQVEALASLIPTLMQNFSMLLTSKVQELDADEELDVTVEEELKNYIEELIDIADHSTKFFSLQYHAFLPALLQALQDLHIVLSVDFKALIIEFLVTLCVGNPKAIKKFKPNNGNGEKHYFVKTFLPYLIDLMTHFDSEDSLWDKEISIEEMNSNEIHFIAETALIRCLGSLGATTVHNVIMTTIAEHLRNANSLQMNDPESMSQVIACLQVIGGYVEISHTLENLSLLQQHRQEVLQMIAHYLTYEQYPRIRYAAYYALSQFIIHHMDNMPNEVAYQILQTLLTQLTSISSARVKRALLLCFVNLFEVMNVNIWTKEHFHVTLSTVLQGLLPSPNIVQEVILTIVITLLEVSRSYPIYTIWKDYYHDIMPICKQLLFALHSHQYHNDIHSLQINIYDSLLEAMSLLGEAAGMECFLQDAREIMTILNTTKQPGKEQEDLGGIKAYVRIARCLGADFAPYLSVTMQKISHALAQDVIVSDHDDHTGSNGNNGDEEDQDVDMVESAEGLVAVRTSLVEEQLTALQCLALIMANKNMYEYYLPYYEYTLQVIQKCSKSVHEDIRSHTLVLLPEVIKYMKWIQCYAQGQQQQQQGQGQGGVTQSTPSSGSGGSLVDTVRVLLSHLHPQDVLGNAIQACLQVLEAEGSVDIVITALQVLKQIIFSACETTTVTSTEQQQQQQGNDSNTSYKAILTSEQLAIIAQSIKTVLRDALQRRAVLKAEIQLDTLSPGYNNNEQGDGNDGDGNDDGVIEDIKEEELLAAQNVELNYHISEILSALFQTHAFLFYSIYRQYWHELIVNLSHLYCVKEDRRLAMLITCDVLQYAFHTQDSNINTNNSSTTVVVGGGAVEVALKEYLISIYPVLIAIVGDTHDNNEKGGDRMIDWESQRAASYALSVLFDQYASFIIKQQSVDISIEWVYRALAALRQCTIQANANATSSASNEGEEEDPQQAEARGCCLDNAIAAVGAILEQSLVVPYDLPLPFEQLYQQYLLAWPLRHDVEEGEKCLLRLYRMLLQHPVVMWSVYSTQPTTLLLTIQALIQTAVVLSEAMLEEGKRCCQVILREVSMINMSNTGCSPPGGLPLEAAIRLREHVWEQIPAVEKEMLLQIINQQQQSASSTTAGGYHISDVKLR